MRRGTITQARQSPCAIEVISLKNGQCDLIATDTISRIQVNDESGQHTKYSYTLYANRAKIGTYEEMVAALVDLKYSMADEISLMRKGIADPQNAEYVAYTEYVNACKDFARELYSIEVNA